MLLALVIVSSLSGAILRGTNAPTVTLLTVPVTNVVASAGMQFTVSGDRVLTVSSDATTQNGYQLSTGLETTYLSSTPSVAYVTNGNLTYQSDGSAILLATTPLGTFTRRLSFVQQGPSTVTNFFAFNAGTLGSNLNLTISNFYGGKAATASTWNLFSNSAMIDLNTQRWATNVDFSAFISRDMSGSGPMVLITSRHAISCMHAWDWTVGNRIYAVGTNAVRYTNWIQSTASMGDDCRLVTLSNNFPSQVVPSWILPTNWSAKLSVPNWNVCWFRANSRHLATSQTVVSGSDYIQANLNIPASAFNETVATGGDSGGPMWLMLSNRLVFACALYGAGVNGPFVSNARYYTNIVAAIGTNTLNVVDISAYP